jgi:carbon-monoxide dehydrogenase small subunit
VELTLTVDGVVHRLPADAGTRSLLRVLREDLGLTATKNACEQGECGSCTVSLDGEVACACLVLAGQVDGARIDTVAGMAAPDGTLHPLQTAFLESGAVQCGFCTPGLLVAARDLLHRVPDPTEDDVREGLAGNLCRCTGYDRIVAAVLTAAPDLREDFVFAGEKGAGRPSRGERRPST